MTRPTPDFILGRRAGRSGLVLPPLSLGLWQNFGSNKSFETQRELILAAYDRGIWHFDNANRYGPPHGWAEDVLGRVLAEDLAGHRNAILVSTKAGNPIAAGPYGRGGSRKHILESLDDSLRRLRLDHVDVFYSHSPDPDVPLEETAAALTSTVTSGKALYVGISNYDADATRRIAALLRDAGTPLVVHQHRYSLLERTPETGLQDALRDERAGGVVFSPLAQGLLTSRYLDGSIPADARAAWSSFLSPDFLTEQYLTFVRGLDALARERGQTIAQLALQWVLRDEIVATALVGVSSIDQLTSNLDALSAPPLEDEVLARIDTLLESAPVLPRPARGLPPVAIN